MRAFDLMFSLGKKPELKKKHALKKKLNEKLSKTIYLNKTDIKLPYHEDMGHAMMS